jgi:hypothetical protein
VVLLRLRVGKTSHPDRNVRAQTGLIFLWKPSAAGDTFYLSRLDRLLDLLQVGDGPFARSVCFLQCAPVLMAKSKKKNPSAALPREFVAGHPYWLPS